MPSEAEHKDEKDEDVNFSEGPLKKRRVSVSRMAFPPGPIRHHVWIHPFHLETNILDGMT